MLLVLGLSFAKMQTAGMGVKAWQLVNRLEYLQKHRSTKIKNDKLLQH